MWSQVESDYWIGCSYHLKSTCFVMGFHGNFFLAQGMKHFTLHFVGPKPRFHWWWWTMRNAWLAMLGSRVALVVSARETVYFFNWDRIHDKETVWLTISLAGLMFLIDWHSSLRIIGRCNQWVIFAGEVKIGWWWVRLMLLDCACCKVWLIIWVRVPQRAWWLMLPVESWIHAEIG